MALSKVQMLLDLLAGWAEFVAQQNETVHQAEAQSEPPGFALDDYPDRYADAVADLYQQAGQLEDDRQVEAFLHQHLVPFLLHPERI
ncbi:MAG TPA: hypothetical protein VFS50_15585 [Meiothermus sp.]|jgi:hypothetical protein|nr:hypothetical protein [Meiothermus sp.]